MTAPHTSKQYNFIEQNGGGFAAFTKPLNGKSELLLLVEGGDDDLNSHIVTACNAHDQLVTALRLVLKTCSDLPPEHRKQAEQALALVEGGKK